MLAEQIEINKKHSFELLVELKKQNKETIEINEGIFSYITKRGLIKKFVCFTTFSEYRNSDFYPQKAERVNSLYFVEIK